MPTGPFPTSIVCTVRFAAGSILVTVPSDPFVTQTGPPPTVTPAGPSPTSIVCLTSLVSGSMRITLPSSVFATQTAPAPAATPPGDEPTGIAEAIRPLAGSMTPTEFALDDALAVDPPPCVSRTPIATPTPAAAKVATKRARRPGRRQRRASSSAAASASSPSRPAKGAGAAALSGGKLSCRPGATSWKSRSRSSRSFSWCSPRSRTETAGRGSSRSSSLVVCDGSTCPPWPAAQIRAARCTPRPTYRSPAAAGSPVWIGCPCARAGGRPRATDAARARAGRRLRPRPRPSRGGTPRRTSRPACRSHGRRGVRTPPGESAGGRRAPRRTGRATASAGASSPRCR
jgi:hypothetical protein